MVYHHEPTSLWPQCFCWPPDVYLSKSTEAGFASLTQQLQVRILAATIFWRIFFALSTEVNLFQNWQKMFVLQKTGTFQIFLPSVSSRLQASAKSVRNDCYWKIWWIIRFARLARAGGLSKEISLSASARQAMMINNSKGDSDLLGLGSGPSMVPGISIKMTRREWMA